MLRIVFVGNIPQEVKNQLDRYAVEPSVEDLEPATLSVQSLMDAKDFVMKHKNVMVVFSGLPVLRQIQKIEAEKGEGCRRIYVADCSNAMVKRDSALAMVERDSFYHLNPSEDITAQDPCSSSRTLADKVAKIFGVRLALAA